MIDDVSLAGSWAEALTYPHSITVSEFRADHTLLEESADTCRDSMPPRRSRWRSVLSRFLSIFHGDRNA